MDNNQTQAVVKRSDQASAVTIVSPFQSAEAFVNAQRMAQALGSSDLIPDTYRNNIGNCLIALELSQRIGCSVLMVMQHMSPIKGRPGWSAAFLIAAINACGRFSPLRFEREVLGEKVVEYTWWEGYKENRQKKTGKLTILDESCVAYCTEKATGKPLRGPKVTIEMAVQEGWYQRDGSKWKTMREAMLGYRSAAFFSRLYCPEITMGIKTQDEVEDVMGTDASNTTIDIGDAEGSVHARIPSRVSTDPAAAPTPADGIARRGPGRPRKTAAPAEEPVAATPEDPRITALRTMAQQNGLTEVELCGAAAEFGITEPPEPRASFAEWTPSEADVAVKNGVALIEAIVETRNAAADQQG